MKWSELFASILGDKDVEVASNSTSLSSPTLSGSADTKSSGVTQEPVAEPTSATQSGVSVGGEKSTTAPSLTQEQFDALNARIAELEKANRELVLNGVSQDQTPAATPESIIYNLCVERGNYGNKNAENSTNTAER